MFLSNLSGRGRRSDRRIRHADTPARRSLSARRLRAERLEDRCLLAFGGLELSSLPPAHGGDGSDGFVVSGILDSGTASISGQAFNDLDSDGIKDAGEPGQGGRTIYLDANGNGQLDTGETSTSTLADGSYRFEGLAPDTYTVVEVQQSGWQQTYPAGTAPAIQRVSLAADGTQGDGNSGLSDFSADGRYVAFASYASNLVPGDTNGVRDVFVYDRQTDTIERVSFAADGTQGNGGSGAVSISDDGRYVAFESQANNLVPGDTNAMSDVFVYDRQTDMIERVSVATDGTQGDGKSYSTRISADGRYVAFYSNASNLVPGDTNGTWDAFVYDRQTDTIERVSLASDGTQGNGSSSYPSISDDGRYVAFGSSASNLVPGDTNGHWDVFVYDRQTDTIERVSLASDGTQANDGVLPTYPISADGRYVAFQSWASNLVPGDTNGMPDVFVYDRQTDTIERVSLASDGTQANHLSAVSSISVDGRYVAFNSFASNLVPGDTNGVEDAFLYDRQTDTVQRVSVAADGTQGNGSSGALISADGRYVALGSSASNLVPDDTNGFNDAFVMANPFAWASGSHVVALAVGEAVAGIDFGNASLTKFYVVNDASQNLTYEYIASGASVESYSLNTGNAAPRGAASTVAGDKTWVVDANRKVYVYNTSGGLLGSWTAGTLSSSATVEGIATNGTDVWIVDAKSDKVYKYAGAASRLSLSQNAASSFSLNSGNTSPKDITTDGVHLWVVNDSTTDKVFKYTLSGTLVSSWTITTPGETSPTGITIDPANVSAIWIVDNGTDRVYQYDNAASLPTGSSQAAAFSFALAAGNTNPQGIADPPAPGSMLATQTPALSAPVSPAAAFRGSDAAHDDALLGLLAADQAAHDRGHSRSTSHLGKKSNALIDLALVGLVA
jgi:archaellum component FlaF (FlaF/FlaG flagellin family)